VKADEGIHRLPSAVCRLPSADCVALASSGHLAQASGIRREQRHARHDGREDECQPDDAVLSFLPASCRLLAPH
jgi:hypothetical protein